MNDVCAASDRRPPRPAHPPRSRGDARGRQPPPADDGAHGPGPGRTAHGLAGRAAWAARATAAALLLAGCSLPEPLSPPPAPTVPARFQNVADAAWVRPDEADDGVAWWQALPDPGMVALVNLALRENRDLRLAGAQIAQARALHAADAAASRPTLALVPQAARGLASRNTDAPVTVISQGGAAAATAAALSMQPQAHSQRLRLPLEAGWEPDLWGRLAAGAEASAQRESASRADLQAARLALAASVAAGLQQWRSHRIQAQWLRQAARLADGRLQAARARVDAGLADATTLPPLQLQAAEAEIQAGRLAERVALDHHALALLCGTTVDALPDVGLSPERAGSPPPELPLLADLPARVLLRRPDVQASQARLQAALHEVGVTRAEFLPTLQLTTVAGLESATLSQLLQPGSGLWQLAAQLSLPLWDGGRRDARHAAARARAAAAAHQHETTVLQALREVEDALTTAAALQAQLAPRGRALQAARQRARLASLRGESGLAPAIGEAEPQQAVLQQQIELLESQTQAFIAQTTLRKVLALP